MDNPDKLPEEQPARAPESDPDRPFRIWRLLAAIGVVVIVLALVSALVDYLVIGPLEGRI